jgi:hypothetical protein
LDRHEFGLDVWLAILERVGAISKLTMRQLDAICPPPVRAFSAADIKRLRERLTFSQPGSPTCCTRRRRRCGSGSRATRALQGLP